MDGKTSVIEAKIFIGSRIEEKAAKKQRYSPYDGRVVSTSPLCDEKDAHAALRVAKNAFEASKSAPLSQRIAWLEDVAKSIEEEKELFAKTITDEIGKPILFSRIEVDRCVETIRLTAHALSHLRGETIPTDATPSGRASTAFWRRVPAGVVVAITPFNFPLNLAAHKLAPALGAGCSVVFKPTPEAPATGYLLSRAFIESAYAVPDALSIVYGDAEVGSALVGSEIPRVVSFTGSVQAGNIITKTAGIKKVSLELGGNAATFVEKSADIDYAAKRCAFGAFVNSGQVCISLQRIYVQEMVYDRFAEAMARACEGIKVGSPYDEATFMGPLINDEANERAMRWIRSAVQEGARLVAGGKMVDKIFLPTVMADVHDGMQIVCEEVFAPIVSLVKVKDFDEAVAKMNNSPYGLQFSLFSNDLGIVRQAMDRFECGGIVVNDVPTVRFDIQPYGGIKLSGIGREGPQFALEEFTEIQSVVIF